MLSLSLSKGIFILTINTFNSNKYFSKLELNSTMLIAKLNDLLSSGKGISNTVTSRLFTHIVSTEKRRKDLRDRKDSRGTSYTYYISCFLILLLLKVDMGLFHF